MSALDTSADPGGRVVGLRARFADPRSRNWLWLGLLVLVLFLLLQLPA